MLEITYCHNDHSLIRKTGRKMTCYHNNSSAFKWGSHDFTAAHQGSLQFISMSSLCVIGDMLQNYYHTVGKAEWTSSWLTTNRFKMHIRYTVSNLLFPILWPAIKLRDFFLYRLHNILLYFQRNKLVTVNWSCIIIARYSFLPILMQKGR